MYQKFTTTAAVLIVGLLMQSCGFQDTGPKVTIDITLLEEVDDSEPMEKWLRDFVKDTTYQKSVVEAMPSGKILKLEIPFASKGDILAALKLWEGPNVTGFGMHAVKDGTSKEARAVAAGIKKIADHTTLPLQSKPGEFLIVKSESVIEFEDIKSSDPRFGSNGWEIRIQFSPSGAKKMLAFTTANRDSAVALVVNGEILSAPRILEPFGDGCVITGKFTQAEATAIAKGFTNPPPVKFNVAP